MVPVLIGILVVYGNRDRLFGSAYETPVQIATTVVLIVLGWQIARDVGRALGPTLFRRLDPGDGRHGRLPHPPRLRRPGHHRRAAGRRPRPAHAGCRRRLHRGHRRSRGAADARQPHRRHGAAERAAVSRRRARAPAGRRHRRADRGDRQLAGAALHDLRAGRGPGDDPQLASCSTWPSCRCASPTGVDLRARLRRRRHAARGAGAARRGASRRRCASRPQITLEELDGDEVVVRISATPERPSDGPRLASEVLEAVATQTGRAA